jgi:hypothetical protein
VNEKGLGEDFADGVAGVERVARVLEDHLHFAAQRLEVAARELREVVALEVDRARGGVERDGRKGTGCVL